MLVGVNPYHTKQSQELDDNSQNKSDKKDAQTIAHLIRDGRYFETYLPEDEYAELRVLNNERYRLIKSINRVNNVIVAIMDEYFPELATIWANVTCPTSRELMKTLPFPSDILATGESKLDAVRQFSAESDPPIENELIVTAEKVYTKRVPGSVRQYIEKRPVAPTKQKKQQEKHASPADPEADNEA